MVDILDKFDLNGVIGVHKKLQMRVGVHSGRAIGGVVGIKMPRFHLFGRDVARASYCEQKGVAGAVHASEEFVRSLGHDINAEIILEARSLEVKYREGAADTSRMKRKVHF
jgi:class 3 adenylate cyclase